MTLMIWNFVKMHGAGNDFVVLDGVRQSIDMTPERARALADRHFGVGADQLLLVETPLHPEADFRYRIFNADGSEVEHCGNGARCFVRIVHEQGRSRRNSLRAEIKTGIITLDSTDDGDVSVEMRQTRLEPQALAFCTQGLQSTPCVHDTLWTLPVAGDGDVQLSLLAIINTHAVQLVNDVQAAPVDDSGALSEWLSRINQRMNACSLLELDRHTSNPSVYERG